MKKSLAHLPAHKQEELKQIANVLSKEKNVTMVILFGSYARGDWVEHKYKKGHITYEYQSDFDILVIAQKLWNEQSRDVERELLKRIREIKGVKTWVNLILHSIGYVNGRLSSGQYFFVDIKKEGVSLFDRKKHKLKRIGKLSPKQRLGDAKRDFKVWLKSADEFFISYEMVLKKRFYKNAAFTLHQATERLYTTVLLVFTHYKPKLHDIEKLGQQAAALNPAFLKIFPKGTKKEKRLFDLLKRAYVDARYEESYKIKKSELEYLGKKVKKLQALTKKLCREKIESFG